MQKNLNLNLNLRTDHTCAYHCAQLLYTTQHTTVLTVLIILKCLRKYYEESGTSLNVPKMT